VTVSRLARIPIGTDFQAMYCRSIALIRWGATAMLGWSGVYAVFCFYLISGYLMCLVLSEVYIGGSDSLKYIANRVLRMYPPHLVVLCLSAIAAYLMSEVGPGSETAA
jgi:peptidoglycan/LPS O-acetylase OafA/YrhL